MMAVFVLVLLSFYSYYLLIFTGMINKPTEGTIQTAALAYPLVRLQMMNTL